jgi:hypothetical protein
LLSVPIYYGFRAVSLMQIFARRSLLLTVS